MNNGPNTYDLPEPELITKNELLMLVSMRLHKQDINLQYKSRLKLGILYEIMNQTYPKHPMYASEIVAATRWSIFSFGKAPYSEVSNYLKLSILAKVIIKIDLKKRPQYWLIYQIEKDDIKKTIENDIFALWRRCCITRKEIHRCMIPEISHGLNEILDKMKICAIHMLSDTSLIIPKNDIDYHCELLNNVLIYTEKLIQIYHDFYKTDEISEDEKAVFFELKKNMTDLQILINRIKHRNGVEL